MLRDHDKLTLDEFLIIINILFNNGFENYYIKCKKMVRNVSF